MPTEPTWLCVENHPDGPRVTNMPGGPGMGMCYFTGQDSPHLPDCGYVDLEAARRVANLDIEAATDIINTLRYIDTGDEWDDKLDDITTEAVNTALGLTTEDDE